MPLYEYLCEACEHRFERIQKFSDPHVDTCPACGGKVRKLLSSPAFQFKGTGWYVTDYARQDKKSGGSGDKSGSSSENASESKSDSKSDSKSEGSAKSDSGASSAEKPSSAATPAKTPAKTSD